VTHHGIEAAGVLPREGALMHRVFVRIRWRILAMLFAFAFVGYVQRTSVAIAAERMMPLLGLNQVQVGWLLTAFLVGYTIFQVPGALVGHLLGARRTVTAIGIITLVATCATCLAPALHIPVLLFPALLLARFVVGVAQAALFPVTSGAIEDWFPTRSWAFAQGLAIGGMWVGTALTPPAVAYLMLHWSWQVALYATSLPSLVLIVVWQWYARDRPAEHPGVSAAELSEVQGNAAAGSEGRMALRLALQLRRNRPLMSITISYFLTNYVFYLVTFWCFLYLVQDRHFSILESGWLASLPFVAAAVAAPAGGLLCDTLCTRLGDRIGMRAIPLVALPAAALFLYLTVTAASPYWAVAHLSAAFACVELTEGPFWAAAMRVAPANSMNSTAVLNTGGNLGGVVATPIIAAMSASHSWLAVFATGAILSIAAAILWIWIDVPDLPNTKEAEPLPGGALNA
jgi:ACS family glucarate transporter-like MFS transporter